MIRNKLRVYSKIARSRCNGPGKRAVIWLSGCPFECQGCFNWAMRKPEAGKHISINELLSWVLSLKGVSGITLSGGEPTEQMPALLTFLTEVRNKTNLSIIMFSGRTLKEIFSLKGGNKLISLLDVLIDGRFEKPRINKQRAFPSSLNQKIHFLSNRYSDEDFANLPFYEAIITEDGEILGSGISPVWKRGQPAFLSEKNRLCRVRSFSGNPRVVSK